MGETHLHTGYWEPGAGGGGGWAGGGGQKADHQGCREQTGYLELEGGGAERETRGAIGSPGVRGGVLGEPGKARAKEGVRGESRCGGSSTPSGGYSSYSPVSVPSPNPDSLKVTDNGSYCEEWGPAGLSAVQRGPGEW